MSSDELDKPRTEAERRALSRGLFLNLGLSAALALAGVFASSSALLANALDNASVAAVYAISLYAVTRSTTSRLSMPKSRRNSLPAASVVQSSRSS